VTLKSSEDCTLDPVDWATDVVMAGRGLQEHLEKGIIGLRRAAWLVDDTRERAEIRRY
jgi:hypothetical protein